MTAVSRRHHAIEHVDAEANGFDEIERRADAHQIARLVGGQSGRAFQRASRSSPRGPRRPRGRRWHSPGNPSRRAPRRTAAEARCRFRLARCAKSACPGPTPPWRVALRKRASNAPPIAATIPSRARPRTRAAGSSMHSSNCIWMSAPSSALNFDRPFRRQHVPRAVEMRLERGAFLGDLADLGEAHHLEAAGVGEDRPLPAHEFMQAAELRRRARRRAAASGDRCCRA